MKLRIAIIKDWHDTPEHIATNNDGHVAAFKILSERHDVQFITRMTHPVLPEHSLADIILSWGSLDRPWHAQLPKNIPAILMFAGGPTDHQNLKFFKHICVESKVYEDSFRGRLPCTRAFGVNTDIFRPNPRMPKMFDALYPASFCFHKNQELVARALAGRALCVGTHNEPDIDGKCLQLGCATMNYVSSLVLADLMNMARTVVIPCGTNGGSQRTTLEAMSCGTPVVLADDNDKCSEFIIDSGFGKLVPPIPECLREGVNELIRLAPRPDEGVNYVRSKWTHHHFARALEEAIELCLK